LILVSMENTHYTLVMVVVQKRRPSTDVSASFISQLTPASLLPGRAGDPRPHLLRGRSGGSIVGGRWVRASSFVAAVYGRGELQKGGPGRRGKGHLPIIHTHSRHSH